MALLAAFLDAKKANSALTLQDFLNNEIFKGSKGTKLSPDAAEVEGFNKFMEKYIRGLDAERAALNM